MAAVRGMSGSLCTSLVSDRARESVRPTVSCVSAVREECTSKCVIARSSFTRLEGLRKNSKVPVFSGMNKQAKPQLNRSLCTPVASLMEPMADYTGNGSEKSKDIYNLFGRGKEVETHAMMLQIDQMSKPLRSFEKLDEAMLDEAYERCGEVTAEYAKTFYLGTKLMTPEKQRAIWAIYVWCRRTDEIVDGPNASRMTPNALDRWEERLDAIFEGKPYDTLDAALTDTISKFPVDKQSFRDMIDGMRMDLQKSRYETFDELYEYCYRVAGTVALMSVPIMGLMPGCEDQAEKIYRAALNLGLANQLTNILRDVGEDAQERNRIYLPLEDLRQFNITEEEVLNGCRDPVTGEIAQKWKDFMQFQLERARFYFDESEAGIAGLDLDARWPVWSALVVYRGILDAIVANGYDNFTMRAYVPKPQKIAWLGPAWLSANFPDKFGQPLSAARDLTYEQVSQQ